MRNEEILKGVPPEARRGWVLKCEGKGCHHARALFAMFFLTTDRRFICHDCIVAYLRGGGDADSIAILR
jgi:hypothetical protein